VQSLRVATSISATALRCADGALELLRRTHGEAIDYHAEPLDDPVFQVLLDQEFDLAIAAVSSLGVLPEGLVVAAVPRRAVPRDVLLLSEEHGQRFGQQLRQQPESFEPRALFAALPAAARVGVAGNDAAALLRRLRPDLHVELPKCDAEIGLEALGSGLCDAVIVDASRVPDLDSQPWVYRYLAEPWLTAPGQGACALIARAGEEQSMLAAQAVEHRASRLEVEAEMALSVVLVRAEASVLRALATREGDRLRLEALLLGADGNWAARSQRRAEATRNGCLRLARRVARDLSDRAQTAASRLPADREQLN